MKAILKAAAAAMLAGAATMAATQNVPATGAAAPAFDPRDVLALEAGTWDAAITFPSQEPGTPARTARGVQVNELRSGGMWMLNRFQVEGTPYEGTGLWGADRTTGRFSGVWVDNNDAQIRADDGRWDPATQTLTWTADMVQPDGRHVRLLTTETFRGDTREFRSVSLTRRGEVPLVEIVFTRRPAVG
jgi:hypothetical protein